MDIEIKCPKCEWKLDGGAYWQCTSGHQWNIFKLLANTFHVPIVGKI